MRTRGLSHTTLRTRFVAWLGSKVSLLGADVIDKSARVRSKQIVDGLIRVTQRRTEFAFGAVRAMFCLAVLARFLRTNDLDSAHDLERAYLEVPALIFAIVASAPLMLAAVRGRLPAWALDASALIDIAASSTTLLAGVLYPWDTYGGLLRISDIAVLPVLCLSAGLRLSARTTLVATVANGVMFATLVQLDLARNPTRADYGALDIELYAIYLLAASALGMVLTLRARSLAETAAQHALRAEAARNGLSDVLQDRHDVSSLLSSARINTELLRRRPQGPALGAQRELLAAVQGDLVELSRIVDESRDRAYTELAASARLDPVEVAEVAQGLITSLRMRFPHVGFELRDERTRHGPIAIAGGETGLERVLLNLLVNAAEGNGVAGASAVLIVLATLEHALELSVSDNGPGFSQALLLRRHERFATTKPHGSGLGLTLAERIVRASGGQLRLENSAIGARAIITLGGAPT